jgi:hypothetical protein
VLGTSLKPLAALVVMSPTPFFSLSADFVENSSLNERRNTNQINEKKNLFLSSLRGGLSATVLLWSALATFLSQRKEEFDSLEKNAKNQKKKLTIPTTWKRKI